MLSQMKRAGTISVPGLIVIVLLSCLWGTAVVAAPMEGYFIAEKICAAYQSKNKRTNPGEVRTDIRRAYEIRALNKTGGDYFLLHIPGAPVTDVRWVHASCGLHVQTVKTPTAVEDGDEPPAAPAVGGTGPAGPKSSDNLLALSWQPAFCEFRPENPECLLVNRGMLPRAEQRLSIHGLWPQPRGNSYCGV